MNRTMYLVGLTGVVVCIIALGLSLAEKAPDRAHDGDMLQSGGGLLRSDVVVGEPMEASLGVIPLDAAAGGR
jgi:hypothetical protein